MTNTNFIFTLVVGILVLLAVVGGVWWYWQKRRTSQTGKTAHMAGAQTYTAQPGVDTLNLRPSELAKAVAAKPGGAKRQLRMLRGAGFPALLELGVEGATLGRDTENDLVLDDAQVSRRHARIERTDEGWVITDLRSANGTFINDQPIDQQVLQVGDHIRLGDTITLRFEAD